ncbi:Nramp-domain-containing protein [Panus rudis PR-1116 ss-1]|nr:Nramp-domain-containing protein [Panus rudis PR-1116 ss-1]
MLFVILLAGAGAMVLQTLAHKLGCVTGFDLASHCRLLLHDRPKHRLLVRYAVLYPLYVLCEIAIISTDLAELLGSAIGLSLIFPALPLWSAVLLTATDVLVFLLLGDPSRGQGRRVKTFEFAVIGLVLAVLICFIVLLVRVHPNWPHVFLGYIPNSKLFETNPNALYTAVGILGATVMPHALFLGSFLGTQDRVSGPPSLPHPVQSNQHDGLLPKFKSWARSLFEVSRKERIAASRDYRDKFGRENNDLGFIKAHLTHGLVDVISSLLGVAVPINSAILVIAATVFHGRMSSSPAGLFDAYDLIKENIGKAAAFIFALALLCAGQTASITATLAGQIVSEGFIEWRISPFLRRLVTRLIGLVPSMVVAIAVGRSGIDVLLVASQVALSIVLPFVALPLIYLTSSKSVMRVRKPTVALTSGIDVTTEILEELPGAHQATQVVESENDEIQTPPPSSEKFGVDVVMEKETTEYVNASGLGLASEENSTLDEEFVDYSNSRLLTAVASAVFLVVLAANMYVIVVLGLGES